LRVEYCGLIIVGLTALTTENLRYAKSIRFYLDDDGAVLIDRDNDDVQLLSQSVANAAVLIDGTRDYDDVLDSVFADGKKRERKTATKWIDENIEYLVVEHGNGKRKAKEPGVRELRRLAELYYEDDDPETAFRLQRKLVALRPDNTDDWYQYGDMAHSTSRYEIARDAYARYLKENPDDLEIKHLIKALATGDKQTPSRVPDESVVHIFDGFADSFDTVLVDELGYQAPALVASALKKHLPKPAKQLHMADLGCGTGLVGKELDAWSAHMCGIDLSSKMTARACETGVYQELHVAELHEWIDRHDHRYDVFMAGDVFVYLGDLAHLFKSMAGRLEKDGCIAFTVERSEEPGYQLAVTGRYVHHESYIRETAAAAKLKVVTLRKVTLRAEYGVDVIGYVVVMQHA